MAAKADPSTKKRNPNKNCLKGKRCPNCGSYGPFEIDVARTMKLSDEGLDDALDGSVEFDEKSRAKCIECDYAGKWHVFNERSSR